MFKIGQITDIGLSRKQNEDSLLVTENKVGHKLLVVADGMGGHNAGDVASALAVSIIGRKFEELSSDKIDYKKFIQHIIMLANQEIYKQSLLDSSLSKMGTTVSLMIVTEHRIFTGHVGDSRIYYINNEKIIQISKDHTLVQAMIDSGSLTNTEAENSKYKNVLLQALGTSKKLSVEIKEMKVPNNSKFLICSDGLTGPVSDFKIHEILNNTSSLESKLEKLVYEANSLDGSDNVSIIVMESEI